MFKHRIARTIAVSIVMGLLAWSALALTASASVNPDTFTRGKITTTSVSTQIKMSTTGQLVFSPNQLTIQKTAVGGSFFITNMSGQTQMLATSGHSVGIHLLPGQTEQITLLKSTATGIYQYTLMPNVANGPVLTVIVK